jgi:hypothetical protein
MTVKEIAARFDELAQTGKWDQILDELYADDAESIEPEGAEGPLQSAKGKDALKKKGEAFNEQIEAYHGGYCTPSVVGGNHFSCAMGMDVTFKGAGRMNMHEICVYKVANGKIVKEQFFY